MIAEREETTAEKASQYFKRWASVRSGGGVFVSIMVYADESGTHDPLGSQGGAEVPVIAGYAVPERDILTLCDDWKATLDKHRAVYYHAREFENRRVNLNSPFRPWDDECAEAFNYDLAEIAGRNIPVGGGFFLGEVVRRDGLGDNYPYKHAMELFFKDLTDVLGNHNLLNGNISFTFDQTQNEEWCFSLREVGNEWKNKGLNISTDYTYGDKKKHPHWPLQAADMFAYRFRKTMNPKLKMQVEQQAFVDHKPTVLDLMLNRNVRRNRSWKPDFTAETRKEMVKLSQKHESVKRALNENTATYFALRNENRQNTQ